MGRQKSILKIEGTLDDLTFYKSVDGHLIRTKGGVSKERIKTDPAFRRTRENIEEFTELVVSGKVIKSAFRNLLGNSTDARMSSRLTTLLSKVQKTDISSIRGKRKVGVGLSLPLGRSLLEHFNFNSRSILSQVFTGTYSMDQLSRKVTVLIQNAELDIQSPQGSTHFVLECGWAIIDFANNTTVTAQSESVRHGLSEKNLSIELSPLVPPSGSGVLMVGLKISFLQELNGQSYALNNGAHNAIELISVTA